MKTENFSDKDLCKNWIDVYGRNAVAQARLDLYNELCQYQLHNIIKQYIVDIVKKIVKKDKAKRLKFIRNFYAYELKKYRNYICNFRLYLEILKSESSYIINRHIYGKHLRRIIDDLSDIDYWNLDNDTLNQQIIVEIDILKEWYPDIYNSLKTTIDAVISSTHRSMKVSKLFIIKDILRDYWLEMKGSSDDELDISEDAS